MSIKKEIEEVAYQLQHIINNYSKNNNKDKPIKDVKFTAVNKPKP